MGDLMQLHGENVEGHFVLGTTFSFQKHYSSNNPSKDVYYFQIKKALKNGCWLIYYCDKYTYSQQGMNISPITKVLICFMDSHSEFDVVT
jgi:hypothetical protein